MICPTGHIITFWSNLVVHMPIIKYLNLRLNLTLEVIRCGEILTDAFLRKV